MIILPVHTPILKQDDDLASIFAKHVQPQSQDIVVVSSKAIATVEGNSIDLSTIDPSDEARAWSVKTGRSPAFCEAVLQETRRLNGTVLGFCPGALLAQVRPAGLASGTILTANAGLDESNVRDGHAVGWPEDPVASAVALRKRLQESTKGDIAIIVSDSCCVPRRWGVTAYALAVAGLDPLKSEIGSTDLFGKKLRVTQEAMADQLAVAGNFLMGNAGQSVPAAVMRDHGLTLGAFEGWVPGIEPDEDLFKSLVVSG